MRMALGCCCPDEVTALDPCTNCPGVDLLAGDSIGLNLDLSWPLSEQNICQNTVNDPFFGYIYWDYETRTVDISSISGGIQLEKKPESPPYGWNPADPDTLLGSFRDPDSPCLWYWGNIRGINDRVKRFEYGVVNTYTALNQTDPYSMWYKAREVYSGSSCTGYTCGHVNYGVAVTLELVLGPDYGTVWNNTSGPSLWWLVSVWASGVWSRVVTGYTDGIRGFSGVTAGPYTLHAPSPCMEFWDGGGIFPFGRVLNYAKRVDCDTDFNGYPIELPLDPYLVERADAIGISYPESCLITL